MEKEDKMTPKKDDQDHGKQNKIRTTTPTSQDYKKFIKMTKKQINEEIN